jgi:hypothetical protein
MSFWMGARDAASEAANAMRRQQGLVNQGGMMAPEPLEQVVEALRRAARRLEEYADTAEFVAQLNEIAFRWDKARPTGEEYERDLRTTMMIEAEMAHRSVDEFRRSKG